MARRSESGADEGTRTPNRPITSRVRYQLRHVGEDPAPSPGTRIGSACCSDPRRPVGIYSPHTTGDGRASSAALFAAATDS